MAALDAPSIQPAPPANFIEALLVIPATFLNAAATLVNNVLHALLVPAPGTTDPPLVAAVLAFVRRTFSTFANSTPTLSPQQTSQDLDDRQVHGTFGAVDADGDVLTYTVPATGVGAPTHGTVTIDQSNGTWTYTPTSGFSGADSFAVTASDAASGFHLHLLGAQHTASAVVRVLVADVQANQPPVVTPPPAPSAPDATSGAVTGSLGVVDPDGDPLTITYADGGAPKYGTVEFDSGTGTYTYTPNQAGRLRAGLGLGNTDGFTVVVTQGGAPAAPLARMASFAALDAADPTFSETVAINDIQIVGAHLTLDGQPIAVGGGPAGIVATDRYVYVLNSQSGSVTLIDTSDNTVVGDPIAVGSYPVLAAAGTGRVYVVNALSGTVTIVDTNTNMVDGQPIPVAASSSSPALSPDGARLFVTNSALGGVFVVGTATRTVIDADPTTPQIDPIVVGSPPLADGMDHYVPNGGIAISEDGTRVYVTRQHLIVVNGVTVPGDGDVVVIGNDPTDPATYLKLIGSPIALTGKIPAAAAIAGNRLYVGTFDTTAAGPVNGAFPDGTVVVVDIAPDSLTYNQLVDVDPSTPVVDGIRVGPLPLNIAVSPDNSLGYTVNLGAGTVSVIDLAAGQKITEIDYTTGPPVFGAPSIVAISPDGTKLYVTNYAGNNVSALRIT